MIDIRCPLCGLSLGGEDIKEVTMNFTDHLSQDHGESVLDRPMIERNAELAISHVETEQIPGVIGTVDMGEGREVISPPSDARPFRAPEGDDIEISPIGIICPKCAIHVQGDDDAELTNNLRRHWDAAHRGAAVSRTVWKDSPYSHQPSRNITPTRKVK